MCLCVCVWWLFGESVALRVFVVVVVVDEDMGGEKVMMLMRVANWRCFKGTDKLLSIIYRQIAQRGKKKNGNKMEETTRKSGCYPAVGKVCAS